MLLLLAEGLQGWIDAFFGRFNYSGPFLVLLLCGVGLPLPEEVTLIGSGLLVFRGEADYLPMVGVCSVAILLGDSIPWWLGKNHGDSLLGRRWVRRLLHPARLRSVRKRFEEHGNWAVFTCRFLPGIRIPGYFTAGTLGMPYLRFLVLDAIGVLLSVPISIFLGQLFGESIEHLKEQMEHLHLILAFGVLSLILILIVRSRTQARARKERQAEREALEASLAAHTSAAAGNAIATSPNETAGAYPEPPSPMRSEESERQSSAERSSPD